MKRTISIFIAVVATIALPIVATAHNAGQIILPDGRCQNLASGRHSPLVGQDRTVLDLNPATPRDQLGVSFVAQLGLGNAPLLIGFCTAPLTAGATDNTFSILDGAVVSFQ